MSGSNRRYIVTALGILGIGLLFVSYRFYDASEQQRAYYHYQPAREQSRLIILPAKAYPKGYQPNCDNPQGKDNADLCAQWRAVDQIVESNRLASVNVKLALLISMLIFVGTAFVGWTFWETRSTSRRELRAYLFVESIGLGVANAGPAKGQPGAVIKIKNFGQTPAYRVLHHGVVVLVATQNPNHGPIPENLENISITAIPSGSGLTAIRGLGRKLTAVELRGVRAGSLTFAARGRIEYEDTFGNKRWTTYHYYYSGKWPPADDMLMNIANDGNESERTGKKRKYSALLKWIGIG
jgi:hypothetical protein